MGISQLRWDYHVNGLRGDDIIHRDNISVVVRQHM